MISVNLSLLTPEHRKALEARQVALRSNLQSLLEKTCRGGEWTGWIDFPETKAPHLVSEILALKTQKEALGYDAVVVVGIGGSYLGTRAVYEALRSPKNRSQKKIFFLGHHLSERAFEDTLFELETKKPLVVVISKSGGTLEPGLSFRLLHAALEKRFSKKELSARIIAITDPSTGLLRKMVTEFGWDSFPVPADIGGRFSVLSAVGLVPLCLAGFAIEGLVSGAREFFAELKSSRPPTAVLDYAALRVAVHDLGFFAEVLAVHEPKLLYFVEWWKQLFGESEGKEGKGLFPAGLVLTTDLHSLGQYMQEGKRGFLETFLTFADEKKLGIPSSILSDGLEKFAGRPLASANEAAVLGTMEAHREGGLCPIRIAVDETLNEKGLGQMFSFFMSACALSALALGLNPFDQPGVESYKKKLMAHFAKGF